MGPGAVLLHRLARGHEYATPFRERIEQSFQHQQPMSSADHERVTRERVDTPRQLAREPIEIAEPVLEHAGCRLQPRPPERLEVREVVERPADRQFHERGGRAEHDGFAHLHGIAGACLVRQVVVTHHAAVVRESLLEQEIHAGTAEIPRGRSVAARRRAADTLDRGVAAHELGALLVPGKPRGRDVVVAVMTDLVTRFVNRAARVGISVDRESRNEPRGADTAAREQREQALRADHTKFAARDRGWRGLAERQPQRHSVEVEREAHEVTGAVHSGETGARNRYHAKQ